MQATLDFARSRDSKVPMPLSGAITTSTRAGAEPGRTNDDSTAPSGAVIFLGACARCHHSGGELPVSRPIELGLSTPDRRGAGASFAGSRLRSYPDPGCGHTKLTLSIIEGGAK